MILILQCISESPGGLVKPQFAGLHPRVSDPIDLGGELRLCTSSKFSGEADVPHFENC